MKLENKTAAFFALLIFGLIGYILYQSHKAPLAVVIQAGYEGRTHAHRKEAAWNIRVADLTARQLRGWGIDVKRVPADTLPLRAEIAVAIHFDGTEHTCRSGASVGYPDTNASRTFARHWKALYKPYFPFTWHADNFTENLKHYYAYGTIRSKKFLVLELGELTCHKQVQWLKPRLQKIAYLIAYTIAEELGKNPPKPSP